MKPKTKLATVNANIIQLMGVGIDEDIIGKEVQVYDIDKYKGMHNLSCSKIIVDSKFEYLKSKGITIDYLIPTDWLTFK